MGAPTEDYLQLESLLGPRVEQGREGPCDIMAAIGSQTPLRSRSRCAKTPEPAPRGRVATDGRGATREAQVEPTRTPHLDRPLVRYAPDLAAIFRTAVKSRAQGLSVASAFSPLRPYATLTFQRDEAR